MFNLCFSLTENTSYLLLPFQLYTHKKEVFHQSKEPILLYVSFDDSFLLSWTSGWRHNLLWIYLGTIRRFLEHFGNSIECVVFVLSGAHQVYWMIKLWLYTSIYSFTLKWLKLYLSESVIALHTSTLPHPEALPDE